MGILLLVALLACGFVAVIARGKNTPSGAISQPTAAANQDAGTVAVVPAVPATGVPTSIEAAPARPADTGYTYSYDTHHSITIFAQAYTQFEGAGGLGYPLTEAFIEKSPGDGNKRWVQYFEKGVLEYHPELADANRIQLAALGTERIKQQYSSAMPKEKTLPGKASFKFQETGFTARDPFLSYWHQHGEITRFGYPISLSIEEKTGADGKVYIVQYFERAVLEYHPGEKAPYDVQLSALGSFRLAQLYPNGAPMAASKPLDTPTPVPPTPTSIPTPTSVPTTPPTSTMPPPTPTIDKADDYAAMMGNYDKLTSTQWANYVASQKGKVAVGWAGSVNDVSGHIFSGQKQVSVALGGCGNITDVHFDLTLDKALTIDKCAKIVFSGTVDDIGCGLGILHHCTVTLNNTVITSP